MKFDRLPTPFKPKDHLNVLGKHTGITHGPLRDNGEGKQGLYLAKISEKFLKEIAFLGQRQGQLIPAASQENAGHSFMDIDLPGLKQWEEIELIKINKDDSISLTERTTLINSRVGQGRFRQNVAKLENLCRVTGVSNPTHLIASHIKPWRDSDNNERFVPANGLLLTPSIDHLFDRGFISFEDSGDLIVSGVADADSLRRMGVPPGTPLKLPRFNSDQIHFLDYHRQEILLSKTA